MSDGSEKRQHTRYKLPVLIEAPDIANDWLRPVDVSMGGFMVNVPDEPKVGLISECAIRIQDKVFTCKVTVVWVKEDLSEDPLSWNLGLWFKMPEDSEEEFETAVHTVRSDMKEND
ncbi:MAG: PilZ domain-containing protein [Nitrospinota bacterium]|jgi:hypothetical protein|nr:PilZ domain-containing protein [Nitrospinota bacterium]|tara:strand:+ start:71 stop:418 length:348 start_codon:yes stop_codon:yes gene_type:complete